MSLVKKCLFAQYHKSGNANMRIHIYLPPRNVFKKMLFRTFDIKLKFAMLHTYPAETEE